VEATGLPITKGRFTVDEYLAGPGHLEILACGAAAAVPDPSPTGEITPMTAQHARPAGPARRAQRRGPRSGNGF
jgi:NADH dehydrogenase